MRTRAGRSARGGSHLVCASSDDQASRSLNACIGSAVCTKTGKSCGRNCDGHFAPVELLDAANAAELTLR
jgi:hypothetical protein